MSWRRRQTATYWAQVPLTIAALLSHSGWAAQPWVLRAKSLWLELVLTLAPFTPTGTPTAQDVCGTWLYNCLTSTYFLWAYASAPNSTTSQIKVIFKHPRPDAPVSSAYLHGCISWLTARLRANMQQNFKWYMSKNCEECTNYFNCIYDVMIYCKLKGMAFNVGLDCLLDNWQYYRESIIEIKFDTQFSIILL